MSRTVWILLLGLAGLGLVIAGLAWNAWWAIAGGVVVLTGAAWVVTEPP